MRPRLWRALDATPATLVAVVVAPSGYGKTTFLAQRAAARRTAAEQAARGGDAARAGGLLWAEAEAAVVQGRGEVLERALQGFTTGQVEADPALALSRAAAGLERAHREDVEHWIDVGERALAAAGSDQAARFATGLAVLRAVVARDGVAAMGANARRARELGPAPGGWYGLACFLEGASNHLLGDEQLAWDRLSESARTRAVGAPLVAMLSHALLGLIDLMAERWDAGRREAAHARACALEHGVDTQPAAALVFAASAFALAHHGELKQARRDATQARRLAGLPSAFGPWLAAEVHVALARAELRLSDSAAARDLLSGAGRLIRRCPEATAVRAAIDDAWDRVDRFAASAVVGTTTLTTAELRVLRMLPSHLSLGEIAARLHASPNTVKTQAPRGVPQAGRVIALGGRGLRPHGRADRPMRKSAPSGHARTSVAHIAAGTSNVGRHGRLDPPVGMAR